MTGAKHGSLSGTQTTSGIDYRLLVTNLPPEGYPLNRKPDVYEKIPKAISFEDRKNEFFRYWLDNPSYKELTNSSVPIKVPIKSIYPELIRLYNNHGPVWESLLISALDYINRRIDCSDFILLGMERILLQFNHSKLLSSIFKKYLVETILSFKYHPSEPGIDSMCTWTENHQIMFAVNEYLAGQRFPDDLFINSNMYGKDKMFLAEKRINTWLDLRLKTGFSEWLSNVYYDEDITALVNLIDFSNNRELSEKAQKVMNLILLDMALNSFYGIFGSTHGRSYAKEKQNALTESTIDTEKLLFGMGIFAGEDNMSSFVLALSPKYRMPGAIGNIALDSLNRYTENKQRMGILVKQAERWGIDIKTEEGIMALLSLEAYNHPLIINSVMGLFDSYKWWENKFFKPYAKYRKLLNFLRKTHLLSLFAWLFRKDLSRNTREEVNIYTYKCRDYMLSCAQNYRKGYGGDQQHIWQATMSAEAVVFTTHPVDRGEGYWVGSGNLPRAAQVGSALICCYRISRGPALYKKNTLMFTHAWFPVSKFDEYLEESGWILARKDDGYIGLYCRNGYLWKASGNGGNEMTELISHGRKNIWICQMGNKEKFGSFENFVNSVVSAKICFRGFSVVYHSPLEGKLRFGWRGPFLRDGIPIEISGYSRYENRYIKADFSNKQYSLFFSDR